MERADFGGIALSFVFFDCFEGGFWIVVDDLFDFLHKRWDRLADDAAIAESVDGFSAEFCDRRIFIVALEDFELRANVGCFEKSQALDDAFARGVVGLVEVGLCDGFHGVGGVGIGEHEENGVYSTFHVGGRFLEILADAFGGEGIHVLRECLTDFDGDVAVEFESEGADVLIEFDGDAVCIIGRRKDEFGCAFWIGGLLARESLRLEELGDESELLLGHLRCDEKNGWFRIRTQWIVHDLTSAKCIDRMRRFGANAIIGTNAIIGEISCNSSTKHRSNLNANGELSRGKVVGKGVVASENRWDGGRWQWWGRGGIAALWNSRRGVLR